MKQQILNLKKKLLIIELPEKCNGEDISINHNQDNYDQLEFQYPTHEFRGLQCYDNIFLPKGNNYKPVGKLTDITEEQFSQWVEEIAANGWKNYLGKAPDFEFLKDTAKESFFSYLEKEGIYFENIYGFEPEDNDPEFWEGVDLEQTVFLEWKYNEIFGKWQEAEEKVWNLNSCYIFEIL